MPGAQDWEREEEMREDFGVRDFSAEKFFSDEAVGLDVGGERAQGGVGEEGGMEEAGGDFFHNGAADAGIRGEEILAGDAAFCAGRVEPNRVEIGSHAAKADGGIHAKAKHPQPGGEAVEDIDGGDIEDAALLAEGEGKHAGERELAAGEWRDIGAHGEGEIFLSRLAGDRADATTGEDEVADGVGFENEDAQSWAIMAKAGALLNSEGA
jgi:hypothetical protein